MVYLEKSLPKIHDLLRLQALLLDDIPGIRELDKELDILNQYYIQTRYPGDFPEFSWNNAEEAYSCAKKIKEFVLEKIKK